MIGVFFLALSDARCLAKASPPPDVNIEQMQRNLAEEDVVKPIVALTTVEQDVLPPLEASDCVAKFAALDFNTHYFHKYARYFRDTSKVTLSEAGEYTGAEDIEEYVRFASGSSPYFKNKSREILGVKSSFKIADKEARTCTFVQQTLVKNMIDPEFGREATVLYQVMAKIVFEYDDNYISKLYVFYSKEFISYLFGTLLNTDKIRDFICDVSSSQSCNATHIGTNHQQCVSQLKDIPILTNGAFDGKDYGCRALHAVFAAKNARHCPHISFEPQEDSKGNIKCQESKRFEPSDLFDKEDMGSFFLFADDWNIDHDLGYAIIDMRNERSSTLQWCLVALLSVALYAIVWFVLRTKKGAKTEGESDKPGQIHSNVLLEHHQRRLGIIIFSWIGVLLIGFSSAAIMIFVVLVKYNPDWDEEPYSIRVPSHGNLVSKYHGSRGIFSDTAPQENMNDDQFLVYTGFIGWVIVLVSGLGIEVFVWCNFIQDWSDQHELLWRFVQFIFPLMALVSLGLAAHQNYMAFLVLVAGLWKFGFPETLMLTYTGFFGKKMSRIQRAADLIDAFGTILHHAAASLIITMMTVGVYAGRGQRCVFGPILILVMQHLVILVSYISSAHYSAIELVLEGYFEWTVLSAFREIYHVHWTAALGAAVMLFAHWMYLTAALLKVFDHVKDEENIYLRAKTLRESVMLRGKLGKVANRSILYNHMSMVNSHVNKNFGMKISLDDNEFVDNPYENSS